MAEAARVHSEKARGGPQILIKARVKDSAEISKAIKTIKSLHRKCEGWSGVEEIRKWRER